MKLNLLLAILAIIGYITPATCQDTYYVTNIAADTYNESVDSLPIVRSINGGTKLMTSYSVDVPIDMESAFEYACRIWEEALPPCLPLKISVELGSFRGSQKNALSQVHIPVYDNMNGGEFYAAVLVPQLKRVLLKELETGFNVTYMPYVDSVAMLNGSQPDIRIVYNKSLINEYSFAIDEDAVDKYDFVTMAMRDIAIGLGLSTRISKDAYEDKLNTPDRYQTSFETLVWQALNDGGDKAIAFQNATKGALAVKDLLLYAPTVWDPATSLRATIKNGVSKLGNLLDVGFGRGTICRDISGTRLPFELTELLGWQDNFTTGGQGSTSSEQGSTSLLMDYKGALSVAPISASALSHAYDSIGTLTRKNILPKAASVRKVSEEETGKIIKYCDQFHAYYGQPLDQDGWSVSLLKNDGTWDVVYALAYPFENFQVSMSDMVLHCPDSVYARSPDGYLRGRITRSYEYAPDKYMPPKRTYTSYYFVLDYLPQTIKFGLASNVEDDMALRSLDLLSSNTRDVKFYLGNVEGLTRVIIEQKRDGARLPTRHVINDFKKGTTTLTIDNYSRSTFTAIGYNDNGYTRSEPLVIEPLEEAAASYSINYGNSEFTINSSGAINDIVYYEVYPIISSFNAPIKSGQYNLQPVDVSDLPIGWYVVMCNDVQGNCYSFKIKR